MKLLVTGRHGQLARSLDERVAGRRDIDLVFAARPDFDLAEPGSIAAAIVEARPDVVINAAAFTEVDRAEAEPAPAYRVNAEGAGEAAEAAAKIGAPIIQLSTDYVFDGRADRPWREDDPVNPLNVYGASKAAGEELVRDANPNHLIIRTSWVVSPFGRNFIKTMMNAACGRDRLRVVDNQVARPTSALDLADAIFDIVETWRRGGAAFGTTYHIANSGETSWYGLAQEVMAECRRLGAPAADLEPISTAEWPTPARRPAYSVLDCARFEEAFAPLPDWRSSVQEIVVRLVSSPAV